VLLGSAALLPIGGLGWWSCTSFALALGALAFSVAILVVGAIWRFGPVDRAWNDVQNLASRLTAGDISARLYPPREHAAKSLYQTLNGMASALQDRYTDLSRASAEQDAILRTMVEGVIVIDPEGRIRRVNVAARALLDMSVAAIEGRLVAEVVRQSEVLSVITQVMQSQERRSMTVRVRGLTARTLDIQAAPLVAEGGVAPGMLLVIHDITRVERLETIRRDFVANVSHELKTPITSIKGFVETLLDGAMNDPNLCSKFLAIIGRQSERLNSIFNDLLALAKLEADSDDGSVDFGLCSVIELVKAAIDDCLYRAIQRGVQLQMHGTHDATVFVKKSLIEQALVNLIDNAIKYSDAGAVVRVECVVGGEHVELAVVDSGPGIESKHLERLFERFYRVDHGRSRQQGGTGLGLAIVKHIIQIHGGKVNVESEVGRGSRFSLVLKQENGVG
jgi:two-component system phosphate regulon sensor histidine kinase PhoR